jgi:hypothetical protein
VYYVSSRRPVLPQAAITLSEPRSEAHLRGQSGLMRTAPSVTAVVGSVIVGVGLIAVVLIGDLLVGAFLRGVVLSGAFVTRTAVEEAGLIAGVLLGAFLTRE